MIIEGNTASTRPPFSLLLFGSLGNKDSVVSARPLTLQPSISPLGMVVIQRVRTLFSIGLFSHAANNWDTRVIQRVRALLFNGFVFQLCAKQVGNMSNTASAHLLLYGLFQSEPGNWATRVTQRVRALSFVVFTKWLPCTNLCPSFRSRAQRLLQTCFLFSSWSLLRVPLFLCL